jgi:hypothetical protein
MEGCVEIAVHHESTFTSERPFGQRHRLLDVTAVGARFRGRVGAVRPDQLRAIPGGLVRQLADELRPTGVRDGFGGAMVRDPVAQSEVFDHNDELGCRPSRGRLVECVLADVRDPEVESGQSLRGFPPTGGAPSFSTRTSRRGSTPPSRPGTSGTRSPCPGRTSAGGTRT